VYCYLVQSSPHPPKSKGQTSSSQNHMLQERINFKSLLVILKNLSPHLYALTLVSFLNLIVEIAPYSDIFCLNGWTYLSLPYIVVIRSFWGFTFACTKDNKLSGPSSYSIHPSFKTYYVETNTPLHNLKLSLQN
jgi:hypothetical protein